MKPLFLTISLLMLCGVASACSSFDECMNGRDARIWTDCYDKNCYEKGDCPADVGLPGTCARTKVCKECYDVTPIAIDTNKAIAYKLDEIQKRQEIYWNNVANEQRLLMDHIIRTNDEISKKLDKPIMPPCETSIPYHCDWSYVEKCKNEGYFQSVTREEWLKKHNA